MILIFLALLDINLAIGKNLALSFCLKLTKNVKVNFYYIILIFSLTVNLRIKSNEKTILNLKIIIK